MLHSYCDHVLGTLQMLLHCLYAARSFSCTRHVHLFCAYGCYPGGVNLVTKKNDGLSTSYILSQLVCQPEDYLSGDEQSLLAMKQESSHGASSMHEIMLPK